MDRNMLSDSMAQVEYYVNEAENDLMCAELVEGETNCFCYDIEEYYPVYKYLSEEAVIDYFEDYLSEQIYNVKKENDCEAEVYIEDGILVINFLL